MDGIYIKKYHTHAISAQSEKRDDGHGQLLSLIMWTLTMWAAIISITWTRGEITLKAVHVVSCSCMRATL